MTSVRKIAGNMASLYAAHVVNAVRLLLLSVLIARELGGDVFGQYSFAIAFTSIFAVSLNWGLPTVIVRDVSREKSSAPKYLGNITIIKIILSLIVFGLMFLSIELLDYPRDVVIAVLIFGLSSIFISFGDIFMMIFRAYERMEYEALASITGSVFVILLTVIAVSLGFDLIGVACAYAIGGLLQFLVSFIVCIRKFASPKLEINLGFWREVAKSAVPITLLGVAGMIYTRIDTVMLSSMKGDVVVGWYSAANTLILGLRPIPLLFAQAIFPSMAIFSISARQSLKLAYERSQRYLLIIGIPLAVGTALLANRIIPLLYGGDFGESIVVLQILSVNIVFFFTGILLSNVLVSINKQNAMAAVAAGCVVINVILNLMLIPRYSHIGAAMATLITEAILCAGYFYLFSKHLYRPPLHRFVVKPLIACLVMGAFVYVCNNIALAVVIVAGVILHFGILYAIKGISYEDVIILRKVLGIHRGD